MWSVWCLFLNRLNYIFCPFLVKEWYYRHFSVASSYFTVGIRFDDLWERGYFETRKKFLFWAIFSNKEITTKIHHPLSRLLQYLKDSEHLLFQKKKKTKTSLITAWLDYLWLLTRVSQPFQFPFHLYSKGHALMISSKYNYFLLYQNIARLCVED